MTDIALTAAQIAVLNPLKASIQSYIAYAALTKGDAVYIRTDGKVDKSDANSTAFRGIALNTVGAGEAVDVLHDGLVGGFTVSSLNADVPVYLSNTAGKLGTTAGSTSIVCGRVVCLTDVPTLTKVLHIQVPWH